MTLNQNVTPESFLEKIICNENQYDIKTPQFLLDDLEKMITRAFYFSYKTDENTYNYKLVTDIIYNEKTRLVARFKDFLIYDMSCFKLQKQQFWKKTHKVRNLTT